MVKGKQIMIEDKDLGIGYSRELEVTQDNFPKFKAAINRSEQNVIKKCHEVGYDTFQTAHYMKVTEEVIKSFWPKRPRRTKEEMREAVDG